MSSVYCSDFPSASLTIGSTHSVLYTQFPSSVYPSAVFFPWSSFGVERGKYINKSSKNYEFTVFPRYSRLKAGPRLLGTSPQKSDWQVALWACQPLSLEGFLGHLAVEPSGWMLSWLKVISPRHFLCPKQSPKSFDYLNESGVWGWGTAGATWPPTSLAPSLCSVLLSHLPRRWSLHFMLQSIFLLCS